jgi:acyl-CoA synthetase (AMP-forming)/AMP-acid ligase II
MTESAAVTLFNPCDDPKLQCLGIPFLSVDARIMDIEGGAELSDGEQGRSLSMARRCFKDIGSGLMPPERHSSRSTGRHFCERETLVTETRMATSSLRTA